MARALITGGSGFVGQWLIRDLLQRDVTVFAGSVTGTPGPGILSRDEIGAVHWLELDVLSDAHVDAALETSTPDWVVHLAGIAFPPEAAAAPLRAMETNAMGLLRLLTALGSDWHAHPRKRLLVVGSAEQYGTHPPGDHPLKETAEQQPVGMYGVSKACQEAIARRFFQTSRSPVICTRSFNHSGVGQPAAYLLPALVSRATALRGRNGSLAIGNGTPIRDFLHVADVVRAYILLLERGVPGEVYNVASGHGVSISDLAQLVLNRAGVTADISNDPALMRPVDTPILIGDNSKLRAATGWSPQRTTDHIIDDLLHAATR